MLLSIKCSVITVYLEIVVHKGQRFFSRFFMSTEHRLYLIRLDILPGGSKMAQFFVRLNFINY